MATKKPSAAQIAARKKFAAMARSGAFKRKGAKGNAKRKANPVARVAADARSASGALKLRAAPKRKRNPADSMSRGPATKVPAGYAVHRATAHGEPGPLIGKFVAKADALSFARRWATVHKARAVVVGKAVA